MKRIFIKRSLFICGLFATISSFAQNVGVGITAPLSKLHIKGGENITQLLIDANSTQSNTSPFIKLRNSLGTDLLWIHSDTAFNTFIGLNTGRVNNAVGGGINNTFIGRDAGYSNTTGFSNTAFGKDALYTNTIGYDNTASGRGALFYNTTGSHNSAHGSYALNSNTTGWNNSAFGSSALYSNTTGNYNSAYGSSALHSNTSGVGNSAYGADALFSNISGSSNTATGNYALYSNTTSHSNSAHGNHALYSNITGYQNTADGSSALFSNSTGSQNTAIGFEALWSNTTGAHNTAIGESSLSTNTSGSDNTAIGYKAKSASGTLNNSMAIGARALVATSNSIVLGSIQGVNGATANTNVGIGTTTPNAKLHVNGTVKVVDGTQGAGKILTSDATGLASWQPPPPPPPVNYPVVWICCNPWMTKNLDVSTYRNGDAIPKVTDAAAWTALTTGAYCYYNNDSTTYAATYGKLYNWYAINDSRGLAPEGWHIPTDFEWTALGNCLGGDSLAGGHMKEIGFTHWNTPNTEATNLSGFTGLPGGYRHHVNGAFVYIGIFGVWWSSTETITAEAWYRNLYYNDGLLHRSDQPKPAGFSVRCLRD